MHTGRLIQPTYRVRSGVPVIQLYGRLDDGRPFLVEEDRFRPYFYVHSSNRHLLEPSPGVEFRETEMRDLSNELLTRITVPTPGAVRPLREALQERGITCFEADVRFPYRFLMDHAIRSEIVIHGNVTSQTGTLQYFRNPEIGCGESHAQVTTLSLDLETTPTADAILSAALAGCGTEEVHLVSARPVLGAIHHPDERTLLIALADRIRQLDPDLIIGWNVVDFDLRVLADRYEALGIRSPESDWGRRPGRIDFQGDPNFTRQSRATLPGRSVVDGLPLVRDAMRLEDYRLNTVARIVLGRGKLIDQEAPDAATEILRMYREDPESLVAYNLEDARLVNEILDHEGLIDLTLERSRLTGMQPDRVGASIASFDLLYLPELRREGTAAPCVHLERTRQNLSGGAVLAGQAGLTRNVAVFDFKSLYPSLIRTFNIDPLSLSLGQREPSGAAIVAPNGARFSREEAILPRIIERFMDSREAAQKRGDAHARQAIKIMMNSMYGVFASPACRFFSPDMANAITLFGQQTLAWTSECFNELGYEVIYGDTDSVFVALETDLEPEAAWEQARRLRDQVSTQLTKRIRKQYNVEPKLELELEKVFSRFFLPRIRGGRSGSKKRYAGWVTTEQADQLEIVGLESVRRDWPEIAGRLQRGMLERIFHDQPVLPFVAAVVHEMKEGLCDEELVYRKRIRKGSLDHYTAASPPHVQAARKQAERTGTAPRGVIRYVITSSGPEPILRGTPPRPDLDRTHYLERVIRPVADAILLEIGESLDTALGQPKQLDLL
ncbi:MAG: hypothetical protein CBC48_18350 [bacterium TMED88]|nr:DNA polymerase II [Deltaproteobacteria bacterium]OUV23751.1 MAG: hypothetical protein CBC48_18350 [bacterium TMED88]